MQPQGRQRGRILAAVVTIASLALAAALSAQTQPKFPTPLPAPKAPAATESAPASQPAAAPAGAPAAAPGGRRDPFDPLVKKPAAGEERKSQEIAGLKLVGVIWDAANHDQIRALVETPDGLGYYLRLNEEKFGGTVVTIDRDRVQFSVREDIPGGASRVRTVELKLAKPNGQ